ncbi:YqgE/AlgH family protein [Alkalilimnicola ehrlichii MLHE-1]|uniref:UPF0301 protein Mlg_0349 n=1 Tax=Alkalilimnicola ehrlichii (strain ATCC BAA-1101 / DSM 17681 / MLHE-1) TaxID=187272 RepID=Q0ABT3_ALKEH|nr:YqgE/AlgH family protein [Alkalilimnicola ehrlichii]ABI55704.1 protein of unknown function DUF179 [Alkalilimnicola ehrlichii MLHE-1]
MSETSDNGGWLSDHFAIAMPSLQDPNFAHAVIYICEHGPEGAMGLVINHPSDLKLRDLFEHMDIEPGPDAPVDTPVFLGGPVQRERGFVLHPPDDQWEASAQVSPQVSVTTSRDIITALAQNRGPRRFLMALGYAGWGAGQLEEEMTSNAWLTVPATSTILFDTPVPQRWEAAAAQLGVDISRMSGESGHA